MTSVMNAVTQVVENSDFAKKGLSLGLLNITAYARTIRAEVEEITKRQVANDSSIVMALSRYAKVLRDASSVDGNQVQIQTMSSRSQLVELVFSKTSEVQERFAMLNLLDSIKHASFFVSMTGLRGVVIITDLFLLDTIVAHFGSLRPLRITEPLAGLTLQVDVETIDQPGLSHRILEQLALRTITVVEYVTSPTELTIVLYEKDASRAFQVLHRAFLDSK